MTIKVKAQIKGFGSALPNQPVYNDYFENYLDTSDEWIQTRSGIECRYLVKEQTLTDLASIALEQALKTANLESTDIDLIIVATTTSDQAFPSCATKLHGIFKMKPTAKAFDIGAACNGFVYCLDLARLFMKEEGIKNVAIIGADIMSHLLDKNDRSTVVLFGDGASCLILSSTDEEVGFVSEDFGTDGTGSDLLYVDGGYQSNKDWKICMNGREIFVKAIKCMCDSLQKSIKKAGLETSDIDLLIPHQANIRIIDYIQEVMGLSDNKVMKTIVKQGNTSAASIPLATCAAWEQGLLTPGKHIAFCGFGAGLSWGSIIMKI